MYRRKGRYRWARSTRAIGTCRSEGRNWTSRRTGMYVHRIKQNGVSFSPSEIAELLRLNSIRWISIYLDIPQIFRDEIWRTFSIIVSVLIDVCWFISGRDVTAKPCGDSLSVKSTGNAMCSELILEYWMNQFIMAGRTELQCPISWHFLYFIIIVVQFINIFTDQVITTDSIKLFFFLWHAPSINVDLRPN